MIDHAAETGYALKLLGVASLEQGGAVQTGPAAQRHRVALLAMLAAAYPRGLSRDKLVGLLWPERDTDAARNLLKQSVHVVRRTLGESTVLTAGDELRLAPESLDCDLIRFIQAMEREDLDQAVALYTGPLLDGFFLPEAPEFEQWVDEQRQWIRRHWRTAVERLAEVRRSRGDWSGAVELLRRLLADDPCNGSVTLQLMRALDRSGDRAAAIRQARLHATLLEQEVDSTPDPAVMALAEELRTAGPATVPPRSIAGNGHPPAEDPAPLAAEAADPGRTRLRRAMAGVGVIAILLLAGGWTAMNVLAKPGARIQRIAVLPLANLGGDPAQEYFAAGMHDALIAQLGQIEALTVLSRQSVLRYAGSQLPLPAIARELGVDALIEGSVLLSGDSVRITVQLVRARPETHLLASTHHGPVARTLALQADVAREIARAVQVRLTPSERSHLAREISVDPVAQQHYLRGLYHLGRLELFLAPEPADQAMAAAIAALEQTTALAPEWAAAHAKLAVAYHYRASTGRGQFEAEFYPKSKAAAERALELDETEAQAHASLGFVLFRYDWDWDGAERAIRRALELDPNGHHAIAAMYYQAAGRHDKAIAHFREAAERNPQDERSRLRVISAHDCAGRHDEAIVLARELHDRIVPSGRSGVPGDSVWLLDFTSRQYGLKGDHARSIAAAEQLLAMKDSMFAGPTLILAHALAGNRELARALLDKQEAYARSLGRVWRPAQLYAAVGDFQRALDMTEEAMGTSRGGLVTWRCTVTYRLLKDQPRLQVMVKQVGFPN